VRQNSQAVLPSECTASMCEFQTHGFGFFYFQGASARASSIVIFSVVGNPPKRDLEQEFTKFMSLGLRFTTRRITGTVLL
jgi:hypothetical protein